MNASAVVWSAVRNWGQRVGTILTFLVLVRLLDPREIGLFAAAAAVIALLDLLTDTGLGDAVVQAPKVDGGVATALVIINMLIAVAMLALLITFAADITALINIGGAETLLRVAGLVLVFNAVSIVPQALLRRDFLFRRLAFRGLAAAAVGAITGIGMALAGFGVWSLLGQLVAASLVNMVLVWMPRVFDIAPPDFDGVGPLLRFGSRIFASRILYYAASRMMEILIPSFLGVTALGLFFMASRLPAVVAQMISAVAIDVSLPRFSKLAGDREALAQAFFGSVRFSASLSTPAFFLLGALAPEVQVVAFGSNGRGADALLLPIALYSAFQAIGFYNEPLLNARGLPQVSMYISLSNAVLSVLTFLVMRQSDIVSFVWAYGAAQCLSIPVLFYIGTRYTGLSFSRLVRVTSPFFVAAALGLIAVMACRFALGTWLAPLSAGAVIGALLQAAVLGVVFTLSYFGSLVLIDRPSAMILPRMIPALRRADEG